jgi:hypothetical protein
MIADNFEAQVRRSGVVLGHDGDLYGLSQGIETPSDSVTERAEFAEFPGCGCGNFLGGRTRTVGIFYTARGPPISPRISGDYKCENFHTEYHITKKRKIKPVQISRTSTRIQCPCDDSLSLRFSWGWALQSNLRLEPKTVLYENGDDPRVRRL